VIARHIPSDQGNGKTDGHRLLLEQIY